MPSDRDQATRDAELASDYFHRLESKGTYTRDECLQLTVAWVLSRRVERVDDEKPEWQRERD